MSLEKQLSNLDEDELREWAKNLDKLSEGAGASTKRPETDDELHQWLIDAVGINMPRVAATAETNAPFEWFADLFFGRVTSALVMGSRGSGKSFCAALLNFTLCYWFEEIECMSVGAIEVQAQRVYDHVRSFQDKAEDRLGESIVKDSLRSRTTYKTGAKYEIVTSSRSAVNGPHSQMVHRDEIELMDMEVYKESLNIEKSKKIRDGEMLGTRTLLTSTRKTSAGLMQKLLDECKKAEEEGRTAPFKVYNTNIFDVMEKQNNCRVAYPDLLESEKCNCNTLTNGEWEEGNPRTFEDVCNGALAKSDGFTPIEDAQNIFMKSPQALWEAQQENKRPYIENVSIPEFSKERHGLSKFKVIPSNGKIYQGVDFGGAHPFGISYIQMLDYDVEAENYYGAPIVIPAGTAVLFDEIYQGDIGNVEASELIKAKEAEYIRQNPDFRVAARFGDRAALAARKDFARWGMPCSWPAVTRDRETHLERLRSAIQADNFRLVTDNTPMFCEQISVWNIFGKKVFDDMMDSVLYNYSNIYHLTELNTRGHNALPTANKRAYDSRQGNPFYDTIGISTKENRIGGMTAEGWLSSARRGR
jgi:hypothetical protein